MENRKNERKEYPELEPAIEKVIQLLQKERLTRIQMIRVLSKIETRIMLGEIR